MNDHAHTALQDAIGYRFHTPSLLVQALRHRSYVNEQMTGRVQDNERLEFLGDAVLNLVVGHLLMNRHPDLNEGDLSRMRAGLVCEEFLAAIAAHIGLGSFLQLGKGEIQTNGHRKSSILSDAFEAVIAAVYLDGGFEKAFQVIARHFSDKILSAPAPLVSKDHKSKLQELVQSRHHAPPKYRITKATGPDHDKTFSIQLSIGELTVDGTGKSKKAAEQDAARKALSRLETT